MVASQYINRSFERVGGVGASVETGVTEPFNLAAGQTLFVQVDDHPPQVVGFDPAGFTDISAATAAEVASYILRRVHGISTPVAAGRVSISSDTRGSGSLVHVLGGSANAVLQFPTEPVRGRSRHGFAQSWAIISDTNSVYEYADFDNDPAFTEPFDGFESGWPSDGFLFVFDASDLMLGIEDGFESGWSNAPLELGALEAGSFADTVSTFETFEGQWPDSPIPPGTVAATYIFDFDYPTDPNLSASIADGFETLWTGNDNYLFDFVGVGVDLEEVEFATESGSSTAETFGDDGYIQFQYATTFTNDPPPAAIYRLQVFMAQGTFVFEVEANGVDGAGPVALALSNQIASSGIPVSVAAASGSVAIGSLDFDPNFIIQVSTVGAAPTEFTSMRARFHPLLTGLWTGDATMPAP